MSENKAKYKLRFFFDYQCGGCLWSGNDTTYKRFGIGVLDGAIFDMQGNIIQEASIKLPENIRNRVMELDKLYAESLNWNDPGGPSIWDESQWEHFYVQARQLYNDICKIIGDDFEINYDQEKA